MEQLHDAAWWDWQKVTANTVNDVDTLASLLQLDGQVLNQLVEDSVFELRVPLPFVSRMRSGDL